MDKKKKISPDVYAFMRELIQESLRDWFKKEDWVRISSDGSIAGPCGTSKNKKNPDRCLPRAKANSMTKAERAATARKKKKAGAKGKTVVPNTKKGKVTKAYTNEVKGLGKSTIDQFTTDLANQILNFFKKHEILRREPHQRKNKSGLSDEEYVADTKNMYLNSLIKGIERKVMSDKTITKEDIRNLVVGTLQEMQNENTINEKDDRCTRIAKSKYDTWPSAYASGAVVRCRRGEIWKDEK